MVCVLGHNPFGSALEEVIRGKSIEGRAFAFRQVAGAEEASACQILFVSSVGQQTLPLAMRGVLKPAGILTVGEAQGFATDGGVINFKLDDGRVRFEINVDAAEHAAAPHQLQTSELGADRENGENPMSWAARYRDLPIRYKLQLIVMLTVGAALTVACGAILIYHYYTLRDSLRRDLSVLAEITGG